MYKEKTQKRNTKYIYICNCLSDNAIPGSFCYIFILTTHYPNKCHPKCAHESGGKFRIK